MHGRPCFEVKFDDGASIVCDEEHLWFTTTKLDRCNTVAVVQGRGPTRKYISRKQAPRAGSVKTTAQIRDSIIYSGENNHRVPIAGALGFPHNIALPIDPYLLGLWLGDGSSGAPNFTTPEAGIVLYLQGYAERFGMMLKERNSKSCGAAGTYAVTAGITRRYVGNVTLTGQLKSAELLGNKHIPEEYFSASIEQRIALLRGLMYTDGTIARHIPQCEIVQKREVLARNIVRLLSSLGVMPHISSCMKAAHPGHSGVYWRVNFRSTFNPFSLERKAVLWTAPKEIGFSRFRSIVDVAPVESRPVRCIKVENASGLFLATENCVPTHNTMGAVQDTVMRAAQHVWPIGTNFAYIAPTQKQAKMVCWLYFKAFAAPFLASPPNETSLHLDFKSGARIHVLGAESADNLRGIGLAGAVLDEMATFPSFVWQEIVRPMLSDRQGWAVFLGTPNGRNEFHRLYLQALADPKHWFLLVATAEESGILPKDELEDLRRTMTDEQFRQEYLCDFTAAITGSYYGKLMVDAEREGRIARVLPVPGVPIDTAWDLGISDSTAIWAFQIIGDELNIVGFYQCNGQPLAHYVAELNSRGWANGTDWMPHDARVKEYSTGKTRIENLIVLGRNPVIAPAQKLADGINACRLTIPKCKFDAANCEEGLECLRQYSQAWDSRNNCFIDHPKHDMFSHGADSFRYLSCAWQAIRPPKPVVVMPKSLKPISSMSYDEYVNPDHRQRGMDANGVHWEPTAPRGEYRV